MKEKRSKRSSFLETATAVLLLISPKIAEASWNSPVRYRTRWSPYAFNAQTKSGLVSGTLHIPLMLLVLTIMV